MRASTRLAASPDRLRLALRVLAPQLVATLVLAQGVTPPASFGIYKCRGENRLPVYQEAPCEPGQELRDFSVDPANVSVIPFRNAASAPPPAPARPIERESRTKPLKDSPWGRGDAAERKHLREGMTQAEVRAKLGPPDMTSGKSGRARWSYLPAPADPATTTTLHFENGKVVAVERAVVR